MAAVDVESVLEKPELTELKARDASCPKGKKTGERRHKKQELTALKARNASCPKDKKTGERRHKKPELTELKARNASCPKGKKMERRNSLTNRNLYERYTL